MRAAPLLAAVAAGLVSVTAAAADETPARSVPATFSPAPAPTPIAAAPAAETAAKPASSEEAEPAAPAMPVRAALAPASSAPPPVRKPDPPSLVVKINLATQRLHLHYDGREQEAWPISSGRSGYATPRGVFRPQWASRIWYSRKYDNAPMPHAVFFSGGVAVHGTQSLGLLGQPASHGCVRLAPGNAARFYALVHRHGFARTRIEVFGTPPPPRIARRDVPAGDRNRMATRAVTNGVTGPRWLPPGQRPSIRVHANGIVYLPAGSPHSGRSSFVYNGVTYIRVR